MTALYGRGRDHATLPDALAAAGLDPGVALLTSPTWHRMARVIEGALRGKDGPIDSGPVFEARAFDGVRELRWLHTAAGRGRAILLAEDPAVLPAGFGDPLPSTPVVATLDQQHLLWGEAEPDDGSGWSTLYSPRIGSLPVPLATTRRARLAVREYVAVEPVHGNCYIIDERLVGLSAYTPPEER
jgi:CRISPR-associated protein (TIGR03984 family)